MKITRSQIRNLIYEEFAKKKNARENNISCDEPLLNLKESLDENFELIEDKNLIKESEEKIQELKNITNEISRMKQLVDFRSPLLSKDDL